jgi:hypothetical protein
MPTGAFDTVAWFLLPQSRKRQKKNNRFCSTLHTVICAAPSVLLCWMNPCQTGSIRSHSTVLLFLLISLLHFFAALKAQWYSEKVHGFQSHNLNYFSAMSTHLPFRSQWLTRSKFRINVRARGEKRAHPHRPFFFFFFFYKKKWLLTMVLLLPISCSLYPALLSVLARVAILLWLRKSIIFWVPRCWDTRLTWVMSIAAASRYAISGAPACWIATFFRRWT